jgi:hypothetical protein
MSDHPPVLEVCVRAVGVVGPGLTGWAAARAVLAGQERHVPARTEVPAPVLLSPAERRRAGRVLRLAVAAAAEATAEAGADVASVFTSSGGDGDNCHELCVSLATERREVSPTRFMNSVHNAPAGYWGLAVHAMQPSTALCAHDGSFGAGLLEAATQSVSSGRPVLLVAYDADYPEPLRSARPVPDGFATALLLEPVPGGPGCLSRLRLQLAGEPPTVLDDAGLEDLRRAIPAARSLPLLAALARGGEGRCVLDYLDELRIAIDWRPC